MADHTFVDAPPVTPRGTRPTVDDARRRAAVYIPSIQAHGTLLYVGRRSGRTKVRADLSDTRTRYVLTRADDCIVTDSGGGS